MNERRGEGGRNTSIVDTIELVVRRGTRSKKKGGNKYMLRSVPKTVSAEPMESVADGSDVVAALTVSSSSLSFGNEGRRWYEKSAGRKKR